MIVYKTGFVYDHWTSSDTVERLGSSSGNGFVQNFICRIPRVTQEKRRTFTLFREQTAACKLRRCFKFFAEGNCVVKADVKELFLIHEEDDSRMLLHVNYIPAPSDIVTRTVDTDVLIIALGIMDQLDPRKVLWLEARVQGKNTLRYISIKKIFQNLGKKLSRYLLTLHDLTGCDYTPSFSRKRKARPLKHLEKIETAQKTFGCFGDVEEIDESMFV